MENFFDVWYFMEKSGFSKLAMIDNKKPSLIFNVAQVDSEEDLGNEIMKSESQEVKINSFLWKLSESC